MCVCVQAAPKTEFESRIERAGALPFSFFLSLRPCCDPARKRKGRVSSCQPPYYSRAGKGEGGRKESIFGTMAKKQAERSREAEDGRRRRGRKQERMEVET